MKITTSKNSRWHEITLFLPLVGLLQQYCQRNDGTFILTGNAKRLHKKKTFPSVMN